MADGTHAHEKTALYEGRPERGLSDLASTWTSEKKGRTAAASRNAAPPFHLHGTVRDILCRIVPRREHHGPVHLVSFLLPTQDLDEGQGEWESGPYARRIRTELCEAIYHLARHLPGPRL